MNLANTKLVMNAKRSLRHGMSSLRGQCLGHFHWRGNKATMWGNTWHGLHWHSNPAIDVALIHQIGHILILILIWWCVWRKKPIKSACKQKHMRRTPNSKTFFKTFISNWSTLNFIWHRKVSMLYRINKIEEYSYFNPLTNIKGRYFNPLTNIKGRLGNSVQ